MLTAKQVADEYLRGDSVQIAKFRFGPCIIGEWKDSKRHPPFFAMVCENATEPYVVSENWASIEKCVKCIRPQVADVEKTAHMLATICGMRCHVFEKSPPESHWQRFASAVEQPKFECERFVFVCNDWIKGQIIRVSIDNDYNFTGEVVAPGDSRC